MQKATFSTKQMAPSLGSNGKWSACFETWATRGDDTYKMMEGASAPLFDTAADAEEAGKRALVVLEATGAYPNMCEKF